MTAVTVVDSSARLSCFAGDGYETAFSGAFETIEDLLVPRITLTEVLKTVLRRPDEESTLSSGLWKQTSRHCRT